MTKIKFEPTTNNVGCYVFTDLKSLDKTQLGEIKDSLNKFGVLFFKNQRLVRFRAYYRIKPHAPPLV